MIMQGEIAALGEGVITGTESSPQTALTVRDGEAVWVQSITLTNTNASARAVNVWINRGSTRRRISPKDTTVRAGYMVVLDDGYSLQAGHKIEVAASAADDVEFTVNGFARRQ